MHADYHRLGRRTEDSHFGRVQVVVEEHVRLARDLWPQVVHDDAEGCDTCDVLVALNHAWGVVHRILEGQLDS